jgi:hypothetical protein
VSEDGEGRTGVEADVVEVFVEDESAVASDGDGQAAHGPEGLAGLGDEGGPGGLAAVEIGEDAGAVFFVGAAEFPGDPAALGRREFGDDVEVKLGGDGAEALEEFGDEVFGAGGEGEQDLASGIHV